jgi:MOSC domain-containing protein YiiM
VSDANEFQIVSIQVGKPQVYHDLGLEWVSGINKAPIEGSIYLSKTNLEGDQQADLKNHGGVDKAICVYSFVHYPYWEGQLNCKLLPGAFGENLTVQDMQESDVYIGDIFQFGEALVQISQPRQPCYKLAKKHKIKDLAAQVAQTGFTGFYFRVIQTGKVSSKLGLKRIESHPARLSIQYANHIMYDAKNNKTGLEALLGIDALSDSWRHTLTKRLNTL